ncbi:MAG: hypothetical protein AAF411_26015, partial [Myxococcota bacterium]
IAEYERFVRAIERLRQQGTDAASVCRRTLDRSIGDSQHTSDQLEFLVSGIARVRDRMCALHAEILSPPPDRQRSMDRLATSFDRRRRDLRRRPPDVLAPADLERLLTLLGPAEQAAQQRPFPCDASAFSALDDVARDLGPRAAQPAVTVGQAVRRICTMPRQLPSRERQYIESLERAQSVSETNIATQRDIVQRLTAMTESTR